MTSRICACSIRRTSRRWIQGTSPAISSRSRKGVSTSPMRRRRRTRLGGDRSRRNRTRRRLDVRRTWRRPAPAASCVGRRAFAGLSGGDPRSASAGTAGERDALPTAAATTLWARQRLEAAAAELSHFELDAEEDASALSCGPLRARSPAAAAMVGRLERLRVARATIGDGDGLSTRLRAAAAALRDRLRRAVRNAR